MNILLTTLALTCLALGSWLLISKKKSVLSTIAMLSCFIALQGIIGFVNSDQSEKRMGEKIVTQQDK